MGKSWISDDKILKIISKHKAVSIPYLRKVLKRKSDSNLIRRLKNLVCDGKLQCRLIPGSCRQSKYRFYNKYAGVTIYYITDDDLSIWAHKQVPSEITPSLQKAITRHFHADLGIDYHPRIKKKTGGTWA